MSEQPIDPQDPGASAPDDAPPAGDVTTADTLQKERDDLHDRLLRKTAEFDNFRKRVERDRKDMIEWAAADVISDLLSIVDDFDRALAAEAPPEAQSFKAGLELIQRQLSELLKKRGVSTVEALGADFDPHLHQAVAYEEVPGAREGEVVGVMAKGYKLGDRLLRPALVKVAKSIVSKRDYYEILEVTKTATDQEIKSSYRKLALKFHPDRNQGDKKAEERFKEAAEAYAILSDLDKRARYDRFGHAGVGGGAQGFDPSQFTGFEDIFGGLGDIFGFGGGGRRSGPQRGADLRYDLEIKFEEAAKGVETHIQIPRHETCEKCKGNGAAPGTTPATCPQCRGTGQLRYQQGFFTVARTCGQCRGGGKVITKPCPECHGAGSTEQTRKLTVKIPAGIATGQRLRLSAEGEAGTLGGPPGDLYVVIFVREHEFFQRDGNNLQCTVPLAFTTLALGADVQVPGIDGEETLKVPESTQTGTTFRIRGKGMPDVSGRGRGDLLVTVQAITPKKLTKDQKKLLEQLAATLPSQTVKPSARDDDDDRGIFGKVKDIFG